MAGQDDGPQRQADLVKVLDSDAATMTRTVQRLERAGFVRRRPSPTDRRAVIVESTTAGHALRTQVENAGLGRPDDQRAGPRPP